MMFDTTPHEQAKARMATENSHKKMAGIWFLPRLTRCDCCGKRRTSSTGKLKKSGKFVCHGCSKGA